MRGWHRLELQRETLEEPVVPDLQYVCHFMAFANVSVCVKEHQRDQLCLLLLVGKLATPYAEAPYGVKKTTQ